MRRKLIKMKGQWFNNVRPLISILLFLRKYVWEGTEYTHRTAVKCSALFFMSECAG